jgi:hypothetical protein
MRLSHEKKTADLSTPPRSGREHFFLSIHSPDAQWKRRPPLCHPDRSEAQWRDLQFNGPLVEMFPWCDVFLRKGLWGLLGNCSIAQPKKVR